jgi:ribosomal protein S10
MRAECWHRSDLEHLAAVSDLVWSFTLMTEEFDDHLLSALPDLPCVEIFEHRACTLGTEAMSAFLRFPKLRSLRLHLIEPSVFHADADGGQLGTLADLTITNLPPRPWGQEMLAEVASHLTSVRLSAKETLWLDAAFSSSLEDVSLTAANVAGSTRLPARLDNLTIGLSAAADEDLITLLDGVTHIRSLSLRGTPASDAIVPALERYDLDHLDLVDTEVTAATLSGFRADHPGISVLPRVQ